MGDDHDEDLVVCIKRTNKRLEKIRKEAAKARKRAENSLLRVDLMSDVSRIHKQGNRRSARSDPYVYGRLDLQACPWHLEQIVRHRHRRHHLYTQPGSSIDRGGEALSSNVDMKD
jgi:hypothetical protein